jgi:uncharacterized protein YjiS (DUF1127 family)
MAPGACTKPQHDGFWAALANSWSRLVGSWRQERAMAEAEEALAALDDRLLKDIGVARDDIHFIVRNRRR